MRKADNPSSLAINFSRRQRHSASGKLLGRTDPEPPNLFSGIHRHGNRSSGDGDRGNRKRRDGNTRTNCEAYSFTGDAAFECVIDCAVRFRSKRRHLGRGIRAGNSSSSESGADPKRVTATSDGAATRHCGSAALATNGGAGRTIAPVSR
jgi:hypothetical protein